MSFKDNFKSFIASQVEAACDVIMIGAHKYALTQSGDITPEQQEKLDAIQENLKELIYQQVVQNLTEEQLKDYKLDSPQVTPITAEKKIWVVPVCRTGYAFRTIEVLASSEDEAIELALDESGNHDFSEKDADYSAPDGASPKF